MPKPDKDIDNKPPHQPPHGGTPTPTPTPTPPPPPPPPPPAPVAEMPAIAFKIAAPSLQQSQVDGLLQGKLGGQLLDFVPGSAAISGADPTRFAGSPNNFALVGLYTTPTTPANTAGRQAGLRALSIPISTSTSVGQPFAIQIFKSFFDAVSSVLTARLAHFNTSGQTDPNGSGSVSSIAIATAPNPADPSGCIVTTTVRGSLSINDWTTTLVDTLTVDGVMIANRSAPRSISSRGVLSAIEQAVVGFFNYLPTSQDLAWIDSPGNELATGLPETDSDDVWTYHGINALAGGLMITGWYDARAVQPEVTVHALYADEGGVELLASTRYFRTDAQLRYDWTSPTGHFSDAHVARPTYSNGRLRPGTLMYAGTASVVVTDTKPDHAARPHSCTARLSFNLRVHK